VSTVATPEARAAAISAGYTFACEHLQHVQPAWICGIVPTNAIPEGTTWYDTVVSRLLSRVHFAAPDWYTIQCADGRDADILYTCFSRGIHNLVAEYADPVSGAIYEE
jgi:hypothetical protein